MIYGEQKRSHETMHKTEAKLGELNLFEEQYRKVKKLFPILVAPIIFSSTVISDTGGNFYTN